MGYHKIRSFIDSVRWRHPFIKRYFPLLFFCLLYGEGFTQFYESGQDPASIRWKQINTPYSKIIFPAGFDSVANRLANLYEYLHRHGSPGMPIAPRKISMVLHNQSVYSNGFVTLGPRRMELFTVPSQTQYPTDWISDLVIHEYRHVAQTANINQGITRIFYPFFGQLSSGMVSAMMPLWFVEGDAVYTETMWTRAGRGRAGNFTNAMRALTGEHDHLFSFEKILYGSYRELIPNHYYPGYFLVASVKSKYGRDVFANSIDYLARHPFIPFAFSLSLKKQTGSTARQLYKEMFTHLKKEVDDSLKTALHYDSFGNKDNERNISYNFPQPYSENTVITLKSGLDKIPGFVLLHADGSEETVFIPGMRNNDRFSYANGIIAWTEVVPDVRWSNRDYSVVRIYDIAHKKAKMLSHKTRYFAAALNHEATRVATVEVSHLNEVFIVIIDVASGNILERTKSPEGWMISDPVFSSDDHSVIVVASGTRGNALYQYHLNTSQWQPVTPIVNYNLSNPSDTREYMYFSADIYGKNDLFALDKRTSQIYRISRISYGAFEPTATANGSVLYFSEYSSTGYKPRFLPYAPEKWELVTSVPEYPDLLVKSGSQKEQWNIQDSILALPELFSRKHETKMYAKLPHALNIHSWSPFYYDYNSLSLNNQQLYPGVTLLSQDKLSTCVSTLSYYNNGENWILNPRIIYKGLYPIFDISASYGGDIPYMKWKNKIAPAEKGYLSVNSTMYIPFNLSRGKFISNITPYVQLDVDNYRFFYTSDSSYHKGWAVMSTGINAYTYMRTSARDFAPRWGISVNAKYRNTPFDQVQFGYIAYIKSRIYLPGLLPHHSLQIYGAYQKQDPKNYLYASMLGYVRGYATGRTWDLKAFSVDYALPLWYPDIHIGPLAYFKRLRANFFYDGARNTMRDYKTGHWVTQDFQSMGFDCLTDFHALHIYFPFTAGIRTIYLPAEQTTIVQALMNISFSF